MSLQLSCTNTCQIWMWIYFSDIVFDSDTIFPIKMTKCLVYLLGQCHKAQFDSTYTGILDIISITMTYLTSPEISDIHTTSCTVLVQFCHVETGIDSCKLFRHFLNSELFRNSEPICLQEYHRGIQHKRCLDDYYCCVTKKITQWN